MPPQEIRIPVVREHYTLSSTGHTAIEAQSYTRRWIFAETEEYLEIFMNDRTWRRLCQHAIFRPGATADEALIVGANGCIGVDVEPNQTWDVNHYAIEFAQGAAAYNPSIVGANGSILITDNLIYDITDNRWEYRSANTGYLMQVGAGLNLYSFPTGAIGGHADTGAATTHALQMNTTIGMTINGNQGDFNFTVNHNNGVGIYMDGNPTQGSLVGVNTNTPLQNIGTATGDYAADDNGLHVDGPAGVQCHLVVDGGGCTIDMAAKGGGADDKIFQFRNNASGVLEMRSLNDDLTERVGDILNLDLGDGTIGIGAAPDGNAALQIDSTTGAFRPPRMTTAQKNALTATNGDIVYDTTLNKIQCYEAGAWTSLI